MEKKQSCKYSARTARYTTPRHSKQQCIYHTLDDDGALSSKAYVCMHAICESVSVNAECECGLWSLMCDSCTVLIIVCVRVYFSLSIKKSQLSLCVCVYALRTTHARTFHDKILLSKHVQTVKTHHGIAATAIKIGASK